MHHGRVERECLLVKKLCSEWLREGTSGGEEAISRGVTDLNTVQEH